MTRILLIISFLLLTHPLSAQVGWTKSFDEGLVVSAEVYASEVGKQILQQGGNAVDAAVAVQFALAVTLPRAGNIGGGGFMVIRLKDGTVNTLDFREKAPLKASRRMYISWGKVKPMLSQEGALAVGVPGTVDGMITALQRYGRMPLEMVLEPAIQLARDGFYLSYSQSSSLNRYSETFKKYPGSTQYFTKPNEESYSEGELFIQEDLANVLEQIARYGRDGFYSGPVADAIIEEMKSQKGIISHRDLQEYRSVWRPALKTTFMGYELNIMPPPSSGSIAVSQILDMMDDYPIKEMGHNSADYVHLMAESMRRAFADRSFYLGDPDFVDVPQTELTSNRYNKMRMLSFSQDTVSNSADLSHGSFKPLTESSETTHYSVIDSEGNAVAVTTTLNGSFGSKVAVSGAGFFLNNEMDDFSMKPGEPNMYGLIGGEANAIEKEKRMLSSMTPMIVTKADTVRMIIGASGGPRIISSALQNFLNIAVFDMNAQQAVAAPRIHHQWLPDALYFDPYGLSPDTQAKLSAKGHNLIERSVARSHIIHINAQGLFTSGVDPRGDGHAAGY